MLHVLQNTFFIFPCSFNESSSFWISQVTTKLASGRPDSVYQNKLLGLHKNHFTISIVNYVSRLRAISLTSRARVPGTHRAQSGVSSENHTVLIIGEQSSEPRTETERGRAMNMAGSKTTFFEIVKLLLHRRKKACGEEQKPDGKIKYQCDSTEKYFLQKTNSLPHNQESVCDLKLRTHPTKRESHQYSKRRYHSVKERPSSSFKNTHNKNEDDKKITAARKFSIKRVTSVKKYKASKLNQSLPNINEQVFDLPDTGETRTISSSVYTVDSVDVNTKKMFRYDPSPFDDDPEVDISFE